jgi:peptidyl-prolyl cis-trans isomerase SurA
MAFFPFFTRRPALFWFIPVLCGFWLGAANAQVRPVDRIVAIVNDEIITASELEQHQTRVLRQLQGQGAQTPSATELRSEALEQLILLRIQTQMAKERSIQIDEASLERAIDSVAQNHRLDRAGLEKALKADGLTFAQFRENLRKEMQMARLREQELESRILVSEGEIDQFLANSPDVFSGQEWRLGHILVRLPESPSPAKTDQAQRTIETALARLKAGEAFDRVAKSLSEAPEASRGGDLGWRAPDRLPPLFVDVIREMQPGQISPVIQSPAGLHLLWVADVRGGALPLPYGVSQTHVRHILIRVDEIHTDEAVRTRLQGLRERLIQGGASFAELARAHSVDLSSTRGGDLGWVYPGDTVPEFEKAMNDLKPGEVSAPIRSPFGWHLIEVLDRRVQDVSEERKRGVARLALRERKMEEAHQEWLRQIRDTAYVEYRMDF